MGLVLVDEDDVPLLGVKPFCQLVRHHGAACASAEDQKCFHAFSPFSLWGDLFIHLPGQKHLVFELVRHDRAQRIQRFDDTGITEAVVDRLPVTLGAHDAAFAQDLEVAGDSGLGELERSGDVVHAARPRGQVVNDEDAVGISQPAAHLCVQAHHFLSKVVIGHSAPYVRQICIYTSICIYYTTNMGRGKMTFVLIGGRGG